MARDLSLSRSVVCSFRKADWLRAREDAARARRAGADPRDRRRAAAGRVAFEEVGAGDGGEDGDAAALGADGLGGGCGGEGGGGAGAEQSSGGDGGGGDGGGSEDEYQHDDEDDGEGMVRDS